MTKKTIREQVEERLKGLAKQAATKRHQSGCYERLHVNHDGGTWWLTCADKTTYAIDGQAESRNIQALESLALVGNGSCSCPCDICNDPLDPEGNLPLTDYDDFHDDVLYWEESLERALWDIEVGYFLDETLAQNADAQDDVA